MDQGVVTVDQRSEDSSQVADELASIQSQVDELRLELEAAAVPKRREARAAAPAPQEESA
jgi:hypothetical protein